MERLISKIKYKNVLLFSIAATILFALVLILIFNNNYIKADNRVTDGYHQVYTVNVEKIEDDTAPQGVIKKYTTTMDDFHTNANCLAFYVVHQYVRVYIDDKLVYEFYPSKQSNIGNTIGCTWVIVPLTHEDSNKEFVVELTPVYKDVIDTEVRFYHGAQYDIFIDILINNLIWVFISLACLGVGFLLIFSYIHSKYNHKVFLDAALLFEKGWDKYEKVYDCYHNPAVHWAFDRVR